MSGIAEADPVGQVLYRGMTFAGLYQVNIQVPEGVGKGDQPVLPFSKGN